MAYYTICHLLHTDMEGHVPFSDKAKAEDFTDLDWDMIFLKKPYNKNSKIPEDHLLKMKASFEYWYPYDLRCSGKDLIKNHLTMTLYNHEYIWGSENIDMLPWGVFCNGWVLVDGEKMSKHKGNFLLLGDSCNKYTADVMRLAMANSGDTLDDANIELKPID